MKGWIENFKMKKKFKNWKLKTAVRNNKGWSEKKSNYFKKQKVKIRYLRKYPEKKLPK